MNSIYPFLASILATLGMTFPTLFLALLGMTFPTLFLALLGMTFSTLFLALLGMTFSTLFLALLGMTFPTLFLALLGMTFPTLFLAALGMTFLTFSFWVISKRRLYSRMRSRHTVIPSEARNATTVIPSVARNATTVIPSEARNATTVIPSEARNATTVIPSNARNILVLFLTTFLLSCSPESSQQAAKEIEPKQNMTLTLTKEQETNASVALDSVRTIMLHDPLRVHGMLHVPPQYQLSITAPYGGVVKNTNILPGTSVRRGQVLATLEDPEFVTMQEEYLTVSARLVYAEQELKRQEDLARDNVNARRTLQEATANAEVLRVRKRALSEQLAMIGINAGGLTSDNLSRTVTMRAPFNGYVTQVYVNNGTALEPNGKILELVDPSHLHVELLVFERDAAMVHVDQPITIRLSGENAYRTGHVHLVGTEIGKDRTVYVHAHLNEADAGLRPGTTLTAIIETGGRSADAVPAAAVARHDGKSWIFTKEGDLTYTIHEVRVGREDLGMVEIKNASELRGKQIVSAGANHLIGVLSNSVAE